MPAISPSGPGRPGKERWLPSRGPLLPLRLEEGERIGHGGAGRLGGAAIEIERGRQPRPAGCAQRRGVMARNRPAADDAVRPFQTDLGLDRRDLRSEPRYFMPPPVKKLSPYNSRAQEM